MEPFRYSKNKNKEFSGAFQIVKSNVQEVILKDLNDLSPESDLSRFCLS